METAWTVLGGIVAALATAFFTSRFYIHQATTDLRNEYQRRFNEKKWEAYTGFASTVRDVLVSTKERRLHREQSKQVAKLYDFMSELWLVGSDDVVKAVLRWRQSSQSAASGADAGTVALVQMAEILIQMRRDLGDTTTRIEPRDILGTFVEDIDKVFPETR